MSDQIVPETYHHRIQCDFTGCDRKVMSETVSSETNQFGLQRKHEKQRAAEGWRLFVSRSRYWYCPAHGPSAGSKAREVNP